jgi:type II secretion system protein G
MKSRGFTLIELMTVIAIIGVLAGIVVVSLGSAKASSRDAKRIADIKVIQSALSLYYSDNSKYPGYTSVATQSNTLTTVLTPNYLGAVPKDPTGISYKYVGYTSNASGNCVASPPVRYHLAAVLETNDSNNNNLNEDADYTNNSATTGLYACSTNGLSAGTDITPKGDCVNGSTIYDSCYDVISY